jgi:hypothetical protein
MAPGQVPEQPPPVVVAPASPPKTDEPPAVVDVDAPAPGWRTCTPTTKPAPKGGRAVEPAEVPSGAARPRPTSAPPELAPLPPSRPADEPRPPTPGDLLETVGPS